MAALVFAILSAVAFLLALIIPALGPVSLVGLGLFLLACSVVAGNLPAGLGRHRG